VTGDHQSKLTLMSESLRNDGRVWVPAAAGDARVPSEIPEDARDYFLERKYPSFGNLVPRDVASRDAKAMGGEGGGGKTRARADHAQPSVAVPGIGPARPAKLGEGVRRERLRVGVGR